MGIIINGQESKGPYGYLCLGLSYDLDNEKNILILKRWILVKVDITLRMCIEMPLYDEMFEYEYRIMEKDGRYYYQDCPVLNFDMLEIPLKLDEVIKKKDFNLSEDGKAWTYLNTKGRTKYSVNRVCCRQPTVFLEKYTELYACVLDFDEATLQGTLVGFDCLGKIINTSFDLNGINSVHDIRQVLLEDMVLVGIKADEETEARKEECGIINFDYSPDENGGIIYEYNSIW